MFKKHGFKRIGIASCGFSLSCALIFVVLHAYFLNSQHQVHHQGALIGEAEFTHTFRIPNFSLRTLDVGEVTSSCGCTVVGGLPKFIPPFRSLYIPVRINLSGRSGLFKSSVTVDLKHSGVAEFELTAEIYPLMPPVIELGDVKKGVTIVKKYAAPSPDIQFDGLTESVVSEIELIEGKPVVTLTLETPQDGGEFEIVARQGNDPLIFRGYVQRHVEPRNEAISMGYIRGGEGVGSISSEQAHFYSPYEKKFSWIANLTKHSDLVELHEVPSGAGVVVTIKLKAPPTNGIFREQLDFHFEVSGSSDIVRIPVEIYAYRLAENL